MARRSLPFASMAAAGVAALAVAGCFGNDAEGVVAFRQHPVAAPFTAVALNGEGELTIAPGEHALAISAEADVLPSVRVEVVGETLVLGRDVDWFDGLRATVPIQFRVTMPRLAAVSVAGAGSALVRGLAGDDVRLAVAGGGRADAVGLEAVGLIVSAEGAGTVRIAAVRAETMRCTLRGSARVTASGVAQRAEVDVSGGGLYRGAGLRAEAVAVEVTGAGQAFVWAEAQLQASVAGIGRIHYRGSPAIERSLQRQGQLLPLEP